MEKNLPPAVQWAQQQLAQYGRVGATKIVVVPALAAVLPAALGSVVSAPNLTWRKPGTVIALYGQERTATAVKLAGTEFQLQFSGEEFFVTNGSGSDFFPMLGLVGGATNWFPITRRVDDGHVWTASYRQRDVAGTTSDPTIGFAVIYDEDLGRLEAEMKAALRGR